MARALLLVLSNVRDGADVDEFNQWYDTVHGPEMVERGAAVSFRRYRTSDIPLRPGMPAPEQSYVCVYEIEAATDEDVQRIVDQLEATKSQTRGVSDSMDKGSIAAAFLLPVGITAEG